MSKFGPKPRSFDDCYIPEPNTGCWLWLGNINKGGYGTFWANEEKALAHRVSYEKNTGPIPEGLFVLHSCDVRCCVNPSHLRVGTQKDNIDDAVRRNRMSRGDNNTSRRFPENLARGDKNGSRLHPERLARGADHWTHRRPKKITQAQADEIRSRLKAGEKGRALARCYNISEAAISEIKTGKIWRNE